jgi:hypothetical protein
VKAERTVINRVLCEADEWQHLYVLRVWIFEHIQAVLLRFQKVREQVWDPEGPIT